MKTLTIFRHAKSSWSHPELSDHDRPLNNRGKRDAPVMGERLSEAGIRPSLILSSSAVRAWTTARIIAKSISYPAEFLQKEPRLYHAGVNRIYDVIAAQARGCTIVLAGHTNTERGYLRKLKLRLSRVLPDVKFTVSRKRR